MEETMADTIRKVDYFYVHVSDKPGEGARIMAELRDAGANLLAFTGFPSGRRAQIDFIPADTKQFKAAARKAKLELSAKKTGFLVQGEDRVGALVDILDKIAMANISITAMDAVASGDGRFGAILWVKPGDVNKTAKLLGAV
jgi:hypothetical protein